MLNTNNCSKLQDSDMAHGNFMLPYDFRQLIGYSKLRNGTRWG